MSPRGIDLAITPDGTRLVYAVTRKGTRQLVVRTLDRLEVAPLTEPGEDPRHVFVSPDGNWVAYFGNGPSLQKVSVQGGPAVMLTALPLTLERGASWGDDGTIVFASGGRL